MKTHITVLIIEDDPRDAAFLSDLLIEPAAPAMKLVWADRLSTAFTRFREGHIDVALLVLSLPDSLGLGTFTTLHDRVPDVPIVILSSPDQEEVTALAVQAGAQDYLVKGHFDRTMLTRAIRYANEQKQMAGALARRTKELQVSEFRFREMIAHNADGILLVDQQHKVRFVNPAAESLLNRKASELLGTVFKLPHAEGGSTELNITCGDSTHTVVEVRVRETSWEGEPVFLASLRDITARKQTMDALRAAKEYAENLINSSLDIIVSVGPNRRIVAFNKAAEQALGYRKEEVLGQTVDLLYAEPEENKRLLRELSRTGRYAGEVKNKRKDGSTFEAYLSASVLWGGDGRVAGVMGISRDITAAKQAERALQKAHKQTAQVLEAIPSILIGLGTRTTIVWWNTAAEQTLGLAATDTIGRSLSEAGLVWDGQTVMDSLSTCRATRETVPIDNLRFRRPDGTDGFLGLTIIPMQGKATDDPDFLLFGSDITKHKLLQSQLAQAQKLEAIGQLAAGIAHEINTPTQYVGDNVRFLQEAFHDLEKLLERYAILVQAIKKGNVSEALIWDIEATTKAIGLGYLRQEIPAALQQSLEGVERVATIVRAMKDFSHPGGEEKTAIDLNKAIESTLTVARNEWKYVADMVTDLEPDLPLVPCFPSELNQVVLNIVVNAAHAIADVVGDGGQEKGTITVSTRHDAAWVELRIADSGTGIPEAVRDKIFDPFFTTKDVGKGTGQGLAIAHDVVMNKHGGSLKVETEVGHGTTFIVRLPLHVSISHEKEARHEAAYSLG